VIALYNSLLVNDDLSDERHLWVLNYNLLRTNLHWVLMLRTLTSNTDQSAQRCLRRVQKWSHCSNGFWCKNIYFKL